MGRGRNKALPVETREFPPYVYQEFPKVLGKIPGPGDGEMTTVVADHAAHEAELREQHPDLPPFVPPPSSMPMSDFRDSMLELDRLRTENARLRLKAGEVEVIDEQKPKAVAPRVVERPDPVPGTKPDTLAAGEHPDGDPWAGMPEHQIPTTATPPSIKPKPAAAPANKLAAGGRR